MVNAAHQTAPCPQPQAPGPPQQRQASKIPAGQPPLLPVPNCTGMRSTHGRDGRLVQMLLAGQGKMIEEMQAQTDVLLEMRNDQRELLKLQKERSETAAAAREEPATLDSTEVAECTEIAQKVFREEPYAENKLIVQHITSFFGSSSQYQLEKVKGPKKFSMIKAKVVERLKHVRWVTVSSTRDVLAEKHKDALTSKGVVRDRAKADALYEKCAVVEDILPPLVLLELARAVYKERVMDPNKGTISNLTKVQVAFIWAVAVWTLHKDGSATLPMGQNDTYERLKRQVAATLEPLGDNHQFQWSQR